MLIVLSVLSVLCAMKWNDFFIAMLEELHIAHVGYENPFFEYALFGVVFFVGGVLLEIGIKCVEWYRMDDISSTSKAVSHVASFLCFNLALLLRSVFAFP